MKISTESTDEDLIRLAQDGDMKAFEELIKRYIGYIRGVITRKARFNLSLVDDSVQATLLKVWKKIGTFNFKFSFASWINILASRCYVDTLRPDLSHQKLCASYEVAVNQDKHTEEHNSLRERWQDKEALILEVINELPPLQAQVMRLMLDGLSQRDIAQKLGQPLGTVKTRMELAIKKMRDSQRIRQHIEAESLALSLDE